MPDLRARSLFDERVASTDRWRLAPAVVLSAAWHALAVALALAALHAARHIVTPSASLRAAVPDVVWINQPGPGGGGGGGGNRTSAPIRRVEVRGAASISMPAATPPVPTFRRQPQAEPPAAEPLQAQHLTVPIEAAGAALETRPGVLDGVALPDAGQGPGSGGGAGTGNGPGMGPGSGDGIGEGEGGGMDGGYYQPGAGIESPVLIREVKPSYTEGAMRAKIQGTAWLECVVLPDGSVGRVRIVRSLDTAYGLDDEALKAARGWRFMPARRRGHPVAMLIRIGMDFNLH